ncbi:membrane-associated HD superfamily phosphohydrolase [Virgibacillus natechei]|uniref:Membrane-associated HD superfamily phosphohydrolase n=1 Tax=Virgibacillus natechei TaxID=1216297 RepID=A0ABS4IIM5_9BACI|nr:membrane-associated HD superfamily phosphohydrolase [Virgibacillus natechei]
MTELLLRVFRFSALTIVTIFLAFVMISVITFFTPIMMMRFLHVTATFTMFFVSLFTLVVIAHSLPLLSYSAYAIKKKESGQR